MIGRLMIEVKFWFRNTNDSKLETIKVVVGDFGTIPRNLRQYYADQLMLVGVQEGWL